MNTHIAACIFTLAMAFPLVGCATTKPPAPPATPPPPAFPTLDKPLFAEECYFLVPNGKDQRLVLIGLDDEGNPMGQRGLMTPGGMQELMKKLEPALKAQKVDANSVQLVCFPLNGGEPKPPHRTPPAPTGPGSTER